MPTEKIYSRVTINGVDYINLENDTVTSSNDIAAGKYGHLNTGERVLGTGQTGGSSTLTTKTITLNGTYLASNDSADGYSSVTVNVPSTETPIQTATGTVEGNGTNVLQIPCEFEPDLVRIYGDLSADVATRGITTLTIIKDTDIYYGYDSSTSESVTYFAAIRNITGYNESDTSSVHATYSNGTLSVDTVQNSGSVRWPSGITYEYKLIKFGSSTPSATSHTITFELANSTTETINAYYDSAWLSDTIRATIPNMYNGNTVTSASLDDVVWYQPAPIPLNTELVDLTKITRGKYIGDDGLEHDNEAVSTTDYIRIDPTMTFSYIAYQWFYIGFYDSSKNVIRTIYVNSDMDSVDDDAAHGTLTPAKIPANAIYIRLCGALGVGNEYLSLIRTA